MQRQKSMLGGGKRSSTATTVSQSVSVMEVLNNLATKRLTSEQICNKITQVALNYHASVLSVQVFENANYLRSLASNIMTDYYPSEMKNRVEEEVMGATATPFSCMKFFYEAGKHGLTLPLSTDEASKIARVRAIEALLAAAFFGSGQACQRLLEQNEQGVIALTAQEIQQLVEAQIFWYEKAFGRYNAETNHHDYSNIDAQLQAYQTLPALLTNKKAWDAVRQNPALFADVLRVAYHSGRAIQELLEADQKGTVVNLTNEERRQLVQRQIDQYFEAQLGGATIKVEDQKTPLLAIDSKVSHALMETPKASWESLLQFLKDLDAELPEHFRITNPDALADWTEANPMAFKAYFENMAAQAWVLVTDLDAKTRNHIETRNRVMLALAGLRHAAFKPDNRTLLDMRPAIATKKEANEQADALAAREIFNEAARLAELDAEDLKTTPNPEETVLFIGEGVEKKGFGITSSMRNAVDRTIGELTKCTRMKHNEKGSAPKYIARLAAAEMLYAGQSDLVTDANRAEVNAKVAAIKAKQAEDNLGIDTDGSYLSRKVARDQRLQDFKNTKAEQKAVREAELEQMIAGEQAFNATLVENNPITNFVRLVFLVAVQDLAIFGTLTQDWLTILSHALGEDLRAILAGEFAYEFTAGTPFSSEKSQEKFPLHMLVNDLSYVALIEIYRSAPRFFRMNIQDQLYDFTNGNVVQVNLVNLLNGPDFPLDSKVKKDSVANINGQLTHYQVQGYEDPLNALFKRVMLLQLFVSITQIAPAHDVTHNQYLEDATVLRRRLNTVILQRDPSSLVDYVKIVLLALQDQDVFLSLLTPDQKQLSKDSSNPFHGMLLRHNFQARYDLISPEDLAEVKLAMKQLANNSVDLYTPENVNNRYTVVNFFKKLIDLEPRVAAAETKHSPEDFGRLIEAQLNERQAADKVTEIDTVLIQFFEDCTFARYTQCLSEKLAKFNLDSSAWIHTQTATVSRRLTAIPGNARRSSFVEGASPVRRASSALFEPKTRTPSPEGDTVNSAVVIPVTALPVKVASDSKAGLERVDGSPSSAVDHSTLAPVASVAVASAAVPAQVVSEEAEELKKVAPPPPRDSAPPVPPPRRASVEPAPVEHNNPPRPSFLADIDGLRTDEGRKTDRPVSVIVRQNREESKAKREQAQSNGNRLAQMITSRRASIGYESDGYQSAEDGDTFKLQDNQVIGVRTDEWELAKPEEYTVKETRQSYSVALKFFREHQQQDAAAFVQAKIATFSPGSK